MRTKQGLFFDMHCYAGGWKDCSGLLIRRKTDGCRALCSFSKLSLMAHKTEKQAEAKNLQVCMDVCWKVDESHSKTSWCSRLGEGRQRIDRVGNITTATTKKGAALAESSTVLDDYPKTAMSPLLPFSLALSFSIPLLASIISEGPVFFN